MGEINGKKVPRRILGALLSSVSAGVVPRIGAPYIAIGRNDEIEAMSESLNRVGDGEGSCKFIVGRFGSGKSFLIQLCRTHAMELGFVSADCDLSPERRLSGTGGAGLKTYRELIKNLSTRSSPDGGALVSVITKWFSDVKSQLVLEGRDPDGEEFDSLFKVRIHELLRGLESEVGGFDFARILSAYYKAYMSDDNDMCAACIRWIRGEFNTKTEAREILGIKGISIISDDTWYEYLKLICAFVRLAGYRGLVVFIDECVNLYKISNRVSREANYEKLLAIFNDTLQGRAPGLMVIFGGTPQFLEDTRRGIFSYEALRSRLADSSFGADIPGVKNLWSPVIRLRRLSDSELLALVMRLRRLYFEYHGCELEISDDELRDFITAEVSRTGAETMITPREIIRDFISILDIMMQNKDMSFRALVGAKLAEPLNANELSGDMSSGEDIIIDEISF